MPDDDNTRAPLTHDEVAAHAAQWLRERGYTTALEVPICCDSAIHEGDTYSARPDVVGERAGSIGIIEAKRGNSQLTRRALEQVWGYREHCHRIWIALPTAEAWRAIERLRSVGDWPTGLGVLGVAPAGIVVEIIEAAPPTLIPHHIESAGGCFEVGGMCGATTAMALATTLARRAR